MRNLLLSLLSAALLSMGWLGVSAIPLFVGFIPLLIISAGYERGRAGFWKTFGYTALALGVWSGVTTWWIGMAPGAWVGSVLSVLITVVLFGAVFMFFHYVSKRAPAALAYTILVAGWIAAEYLYTTGEVSFPWLVLGNGFAGDAKLVQWYSVTGVFGGSLWAWMANIAIYNALRVRIGRAWVAPLVVVLVPAAASLVLYACNNPEGDPTITVTSVQPNFDPYTEKFYMNEERQVEIMLGLAAEAPAGVDYIIFPETAVNADLQERSLDYNPTVAKFRSLLDKKYPSATMILGATTEHVYTQGEKVSPTARNRGNYYIDYYNSALAVDTTAQVGIHHKSMLVVGVEKMPYAGRIEWLDELILDMGGTSGNLGVDSVRTVFTSRTGAGAAAHATIGAAICWEGVYGGYFSEFVRNGAQAMCIISNDGWWGDTQGHRRLFTFSRLRAIETRRDIARSANTGISGFINRRGDILARTDWDERVSVTRDIALNDHLTFYTRYGDYIARGATYVFLLCALYYVAYRFRRRNDSVRDV